MGSLARVQKNLETISSLKLEALKKSLLFTIAIHADDSGQLSHSYQEIADAAGMSRGTAIKHMNELEALGLIKKEARNRLYRGNINNLYTLCLEGEVSA